MPIKLISIKQNEECQVHGTPSRAALRALLIMVLASLLLIVWHVWVYGPSGHAKPDTLPRPFPLLLGHELWNLLFDGHGIVGVGAFQRLIRQKEVPGNRQQGSLNHRVVEVALAF